MEIQQHNFNNREKKNFNFKKLKLELKIKLIEYYNYILELSIFYISNTVDYLIYIITISLNKNDIAAVVEEFLNEVEVNRAFYEDEEKVKKALLDKKLRLFYKRSWLRENWEALFIYLNNYYNFIILGTYFSLLLRILYFFFYILLDNILIYFKKYIFYFLKYINIYKLLLIWSSHLRLFLKKFSNIDLVLNIFLIFEYIKLELFYAQSYERIHIFSFL
jgi:hypothetical protein